MRQPKQVLVYLARPGSAGWEDLLMHRVVRGDDFWLGVSGGVEGTERPHEVAFREVWEETGFVPDQLAQLDYRWSFPLAEKWRDLYAPEVTLIDVEVFVAVVDRDTEPALNDEHDAWRWCDVETACQVLYWPETITALRHADAYLRWRAR